MITLLVVVGGFVAIALVGIVAAIFIPNLLDAVQKAKQKRTVTDTRKVGTAWMSWLSDEVSATAAGASTVYEFEDLEQALSAAELARQLREGPDGSPYIAQVPDLDGWGNAFEYRQSSNLLASHVMAIRSAGRRCARWRRSTARGLAMPTSGPRSTTPRATFAPRSTTLGEPCPKLSKNRGAHPLARC